MIENYLKNHIKPIKTLKNMISSSVVSLELCVEEDYGDSLIIKEISLLKERLKNLYNHIDCVEKKYKSYEKNN